MHHYIAEEKSKRNYNKPIGFAFLVVFLILLGQIWVPFAKAAINATAVTVLPPDWAQSYINATLPKAAFAHTPNRLIIKTKDLNIEAPIVEGVDPDSLLKGVGHDPKSSLPGEQGRFILSGHRFWPFANSPWSTVFFSLDKLKIGDKIQVTYNDKTYTYFVAEQFNVPKDKAHPQLGPSTKPTLTIYTCGPTAYSAKNRLGYHAMLDEAEVKKEAPKALDAFQDSVID